jgi:hypothetical protein
MDKEIEERKLPQRQVKTIRYTAVILGGLMMSGALCAGMLEVQLFVTGLALILTGWLGRRLFAVYRSVAVFLLNTLVLFAGLELLAGGVFAIVNTPTIKAVLAEITGTPNDLIAHYLALPYYDRQEWAPKYWQEHQLALKKEYHPYVIWRSPAFTGTMLNIDQNGNRQTPTSECVPDAYKVFVFGGSSMWGWGAPDWGTIPTYLQIELQATRNEPVCVLNFGENAYVSTQGLLKLLLLLEAGNVPDLAVFYDGVNEVLAASQNGQPIVHQNFSEIATLFEDPQPPLLEWFQNLSSFRLLQQVAVGSGLFGSTSQTHRTVDTDQLAGAVVQAYLANYRTVSALAETHKFEYYFFWQPYILVGNKPLTSEEKSMITGLDWVLNLDPVLINLFTATYDRIELEAPRFDNLYSTANVFDKVEEQIWIDTWGHVTPTGNAIIAKAMTDVISSEQAEE